jgi:hypothetical protein
MLFGGVTVLIILCRQVTGRLAVRTLANWSGHGIHEKLTPLDVAILLGRHPGVVGCVMFDAMHVAGKARLISDDPLRVACPPGPELDPVESAFAAALDEDGEFDEARAREFFEVAYERTNEKMIGHSGRATAVYWRNRVNDLTVRLEARGEWEPENVPWLLLNDSASFWDRIEDSPEGDALKGRHRLRSRFIYRMVDIETLREWKRESNEGFFAYPRELSFSDF